MTCYFIKHDRFKFKKQIETLKYLSKRPEI